MDNKYSEELGLIMSMYRSGKITGEQKDELIAALDRRENDKTSDCKKIVFRVITEKRKPDAAETVRVLSNVSGVDSVTFDERNSLATVIGEFDVDGIISAARENDIRLRVRDIDINYVPEPKPDDFAADNVHKVAAQTSPTADAAEQVSGDGTGAEKIDDEECDEDTEDIDDTLDEEFDEIEDEFDEIDEEFDELDDEDDDDDNDNDNEDDDEVKINIGDSRSLSEFLKGLGAKISEAIGSGVKAADAAGRKIADFADNVVIKTCDLGKGKVIRSKAEKYGVPYSQMVATVKIVTQNDVNVFSGEPEKVKRDCRALLNDEMYVALCSVIDSEFTGKYKYVDNDTVLKLAVRPRKD